MVLIRRFLAEDAKLVSDLIRLTMGYSNIHDYPLDRLQPLLDYFSPAKLVQLNRERYCLVAEDRNSLVGTAAIEGTQICTFFVHPDHQRQRIGTCLLNAIELAAHDQGLVRLTAEVSLTGVTFYERRGYCRTGRIVNGIAGSQIEVEKLLML